ncbi:MAG: fibronectin type III domain-containing protein, partial [Gammaproteobacteria bacterium]|nr:fibronectin type III domain-containing protein [Gammaproteobacteria bacterium]
PATPVLVLSVPADSSTTLNLSWSSSLRAQSYEILRSTSPVSDSAAAIATVAANQASYAYTDTGLTGGVRYYYKLRAVNETANAVSGEKNAETKVKMTLSVENGLAGVIRKDATKLGILCSANSVNGRSCSTYLNKGTTVTVIATSDTGSTSTFLKWLGACAAQGASCVLTVNANSSTNACATILCGVKFEPPILPIIP